MKFDKCEKCTKTRWRIVWRLIREFFDGFLEPLDRGQKYGFGYGTRVMPSAIILGKPKVGKNCWIGYYTLIDGTGGLEIGDNVVIASGAKIYSHRHSRISQNWKENRVEDKTVIEDNCFIDANVVIPAGSYLRNGMIKSASELPDHEHGLRGRM